SRALRTVSDAMIAFPEYVSGLGEFDTRLMQVAGGVLACKSGAEGFHGSALVERGIGVACKVLDGTARGRTPAVMTALRELGSPPDAALNELLDFERSI